MRKILALFLSLLVAPAIAQTNVVNPLPLTALIPLVPNGYAGDKTSGAAISALATIHNSIVSSTPAQGNWNSVTTACSGDLSHTFSSGCFQITGTTTLTQPTTGYVFTQEAYPYPLYVYNSSGWNNSTSTNTGRTSANAYYIKLEQAGQGDMAGVGVNCHLDGQTLAGATNFLAEPACVLFNGSATAGAAGQYLNLSEFDANDGGFDVAAIAWVTNLNRTVNTGALGVVWMGARVQSTGTAAIDTAFSATGKINFGYDISNATLGTNQAAIVMSADQRVYVNASGGNFIPTLTNTYTTWSSANSAFQWLINNSTQLLASSASFILYPNSTRLSHSAVNEVTVTGGTTGNPPTIAATSGAGGTDTNIDLALSGKGSGLVTMPNITTGTPAASLCLDSTNHIIKKTTAGSCI